MKTLIPFVLAIVLLLTGCTTRYTVRLDGLSDVSGTATAGSRYQLVSETPGVEDADLFFKEVARHVDVVLLNAGYLKAGEGEPVDLVIGVNAHLSEPMVETHSYSEPIYGYGGGGGYTVAVPVVSKDGKVVRYVNRYYSYGPRYHYAGTIERDRQFTVFDKVLELSARRPGEMEEVWNLKVSLRDQSTDYRSTLPYMLVAAQPFIGKRTDGQEVVAVLENSPEVEKLISQLRYE